MASRVGIGAIADEGRERLRVGDQSLGGPVASPNRDEKNELTARCHNILNGQLPQHPERSRCRLVRNRLPHKGCTMSKPTGKSPAAGPWSRPCAGADRNSKSPATSV